MEEMEGMEGMEGMVERGARLVWRVMMGSWVWELWGK